MLEQDSGTAMQSQGSEEVACTECNAHRQKSAQNEELSFAFLLALVPALTLSLFGNIGLL